MIRTLLGHDWFIAYSHGDETGRNERGLRFAHCLAERLRAHGYQVCLDVDTYRLGQDLNWLTRRRVSKSSHFVVIGDHYAAASLWVGRELDVACTTKRQCVLIDRDATFAALPAGHSFRRVFDGLLRRSSTDEEPSDELVNKLIATFNGARIENKERRIAWLAAAAGLALAVAALVLWREEKASARRADREALALRDRLYLAAAERALTDGDRTSAALFLRDVSSTGRDARWAATSAGLTMALSAPDPVASWQAEEWMLGAVDSRRFATLDDEGWIHLRDLAGPQRSVDLRWPWPERPSAHLDLMGSPVQTSADGRLLRVNVGQAAALWDETQGPEPLITGEEIEIGDRWVLVMNRDAASLRTTVDPTRELSRYTYRERQQSGYFRWTRAGVVINDDDVALLLGEDGVQRLPIEVERGLVEILDSAFLETRPATEPGPPRGCVRRAVAVRALAPGWPELGTFQVCDTILASLRAVAHDRWVTWDERGLLIVSVIDKRATSVHVDWSHLPLCGEHSRNFASSTCGLEIAGDSETVWVLQDVPEREPTKRRRSGSTAKRVYQIDPRTGVVEAPSSFEPKNPSKPTVSDGVVTAHRVLASDEQYLFAYDRAELLVWPRAAPWLAPRPWRFDLPHQGNGRPLVAAGTEHLAAGFAGAPLVRQWKIPASTSATARRYDGGALLRDGRTVVWAIHDSDGRPQPLTIDVRRPDRTHPELTFVWPASVEDQRRCVSVLDLRQERPLPDHAVLSAGGDLLLVTTESGNGQLWAIELGGGRGHCRSLGAVLAAALASEHREVALDAAGRWVAVATTDGLRVWPTSALDGAGYVVSKEPSFSLDFSRDGTLLLATSSSGRPALWRLSSTLLENAHVEPVPTQLSVSVSTLSETGRYGKVHEGFDDERGRFVELASGRIATLWSFPSQIEQIEFSLDETRVAARTCTNQLFVWDIRAPENKPLVFQLSDPFDDLRWLDGDHLALLLFDGKTHTLALDAATDSPQAGASRACLTPTARHEYLDEPLAVARASYRRCAR